MGTSTNAMLVYGYHLGGNDGEWEIEEAGEYGELPALDWFDPEEDDFPGAVEKLLLTTIAEFTETNWKADGYFERKRAAANQIGVEVEIHCSGDYPMYLLAAKKTTAYRGYVQEINFTALATEMQTQGADEKLLAAIRVLGITPKQKQPQWLLCSYWG